MKGYSEAYSTLAVISFAVSFLGTVLNGLVIVTFLKKPNMLTPPKIIICSMCISDLIASSVACPLLFCANLSNNWPFGMSGCKAYAFLTTLCGLTSISHLAAAAFERYDSLDRAPRGHGLLNEKRTILLVVFLWAQSLVFSVAPLLSWSEYKFDRLGTSCVINWSSSSPAAVSYTVVLYLWFFLLPLVIISFSYCKVYKVVRRLRFYANNVWGIQSAAAVNSLNTQKKMAVLIVIMTVVFLLAWTPYAVVALISASTQYPISPLGSTVPAYVAKMSFVCNPIIYAFVFKSFRKSVLPQLLKCRLWANTQQPNPDFV